MRKTNFTHEWKYQISRKLRLVSLSIIFIAATLGNVNAQCALACNGYTQVSLDQNCEAEITPAMILNADTTICPRGIFEVTVSYHGHVIPTSPVVTCDYLNMSLTVMVRDMVSGNSCWGEIFVEDKLAPRIECGSDTLFCYQMPKYTGPKITDNCTKAAIVRESVGYPWGSSAYVESMNEVFGLGNWDDFIYSSTDGNELFSCKYDVIWMDGGADDGPDMRDFLNVYRSQLEDWVNEGGRLFINAAPYSNLGLTIDFGFGVTLRESSNSNNGIIQDDSHEIFAGPYCPVVATYSGNDFSHGLLCPPNMDVLIQGENGNTLLISSEYGDGYVMFGALTAYTFHSPQPHSAHLVWNILSYLRGSEVPHVQMTLLDERIFPYGCSSRIFVKRIERDYIATDASGNQSTVCTQNLYLRRFPIDNVECPKEWTIADDCPMACEDLETGVIPTLPNGAPVPEYAGVPTIDGIALWPPQDFYCNVTVTYNDIVLPPVGCVRKIMRMWTIEEWWCNQDIERECPQLIEIVDTLPPTLTCPDDIVSTTKGGYVCEADIYLPAIHAEDICNNDIRIDVRYPGGFLQDQNGGLVQLPVGVHEVTYLAYDGCYNVDSCKVTVTVEDNTPPVAICDRYTVVGLTYDSVAHVYAETFDDGTYDDCYIDRFQVRRMDEGAGCGVYQPDFRDYVEFCCADVDQNVMVIFRAWDRSGNYNDCMVEVEVQDKILPHIYCPPNITVSCDFHYDPNDLSAYFGKVVTDKSLRENIVLDDPYADADGQLIDGHAYDNCSVVVTTDSVFNISQCNVGTITRTFTATDRNGSVSCTQTITIDNFEPFDGRTDIIWPANFDTVGCIDPDVLTEDVTGKPVFIEDECDLVGYSFEDHLFPFFNTNNANGACLKIIRKWKVIDWCDFDFDPRTGRYEYEKYEYEQIIKVNDYDDPSFDYVTPDSTFCSFDTTCQEGRAVLTASASDACTPGAELRWEYHIDAFNNGIYEINIDGLGDSIRVDDYFPLGTHRIKYVFEDRCGNKIAEERMFTIVNCKNPTPYCKNGIVVDLMPMDLDGDGQVDIGMIEIWASDLDLGSFGPCGNPVVLSFSQDSNDRVRVMDCDSIGQRNVNVWVTDRITGNQAFCRTFVIIQDNNGACNGQFNGGTVSGLISTEDQFGVMNVAVDLSGSPFTNVMSNDLGSYAFPMMPFGGRYNVAPTKNDDHLNGITTRDLVFIQRHLLGKDELDTPYKVIAADVNGDNNISVNDIVELRRLILGQYNELPSNNSWRFVDADYVFPDPKDPFTPAFPERYVIDNFLTNMDDVNFVGLKIGDVDNSVDPSGLGGNQTRNSETLTMDAEEVQFLAGEEVTLNVRASNFNEITGYQFSLNFDASMMEYLYVEEGAIDMNDGNIGLNFLNEGVINVSWNDANGLTTSEDDVLFSVTFVALTDGMMSQAISLNSRMVAAEAYNASEEIMNIHLGFRGQDGEDVNFRLYQNHPNPFANATVIGFDLPEDGDVQLTIYDVTGKVVALYRLAGSKGYNSTQIFSNELTSTGVLYYQLDSKGYTATKKMVVLQ